MNDVCPTAVLGIGPCPNRKIVLDGVAFYGVAQFPNSPTYANITVLGTLETGEPSMAMSQEHKDALAQGRLEARSIKAYLKALESRRPGRPVTKDSLEKRLSKVDAKLDAESDPLRRLDLMQSKLDLEAALENVQEGAKIEDLSEGFVAHAKSYSERKGISYTTWRQFGVPADLLRKAGIAETRRR